MNISVGRTLATSRCLRMKTDLLSTLMFITALMPAMNGGSGQDLCNTESRLCVTGLCPIDECLKCQERAICTTYDPENVVPKHLQKNTHYLDLTYTGPDVELTPDMFDYLFHLKEITIVGNIASVAPNTFVKQWNLKWLTISNGKLSSLPKQLLHNKSRLLYLNLPYNNFTKVPEEIFPTIQSIERMDLSHNPIQSCQSANETLTPAFEMLPKLQELRLAGYGSSRELCQNVGKDYLRPIKHIVTLDLSESLLFYGDQRLLLSLGNLIKLAIDDVEPYKNCPALAQELFHNMPPKLGNLTMRNWASTDRFNHSCTVDDSVLLGLKKLPKLSWLDVRYGDKMFGNFLATSILTGFKKLKMFSIAWCGISSIESGAFNAVPQISAINLEGNLLGPRALELYTLTQSSNLKNLNLNSVGINIAAYNASNILRYFLSLHMFYLSDNHLTSVPNFRFASGFTSNVTSLTLNHNQIRSISPEEGQNMCGVLHTLEKFEAEDNQIKDVAGIAFCSHLEDIMLTNNLIGKNQYTNFKALGQLHNLRHLDLKNNKIGYLTSHLLANLTNLRSLILADNEIHFISPDAFFTTPNLGVLDLSANLLPSFNTSYISNGSSVLQKIYLQANQISVISSELLNLISTRLTKLVIFGVVGNPLTCSCDSYFSNWVINSSVVLQVKNLTCHASDDDGTITKVISYKPKYFECKVKLPLLISLEVLAGVAVAVLVTLPCYKYRWYISHPQVVMRAVKEKLGQVRFEQKCEYDAFISYDSDSEEDTRWLTEKLLPVIEKKRCGRQSNAVQEEMKLYVVDRDSAVGSLKQTERCRALGTSRKVIILLSNSYLASPSCLSEADLVAGYQKIEGIDCYQPNRILVLVLENLDMEPVKGSVTSLLLETVINVVEDDSRMRNIWQRVKKFVSKPEYIYRKKAKESRTENQLETDALIE